MMTRARAIAALTWTLGVVVLAESIRFALSHSAAYHLTTLGLPAVLGPLLGGVEALAALLFLIPSTRRAGGAGLLVIFAIAGAIHLLHGEYDVGGLVVYAAAVLVCQSN